MTVDTSSTGDAGVGAGAEQDIAAAVAAGESVLSRRFGSAITLVSPEDLAGSGPATVVRARVVSSSFALPRTLVIKHYPDRPAPGEEDSFAQEAVSYQLFTALSPDERMCPELLAHDGRDRVLVLEDLGRTATLEDKLHARDSRAAERALLSWARSLGRLHANTAGREADFNALLRRLGGPAKCDHDDVDEICARVPSLIQDRLGTPVPEAVLDAVTHAVEQSRSTAFRAFSPVELSPDNNLVTGEGVRFLDFEYGRVRSALVDAANLRLPFASWPDALALPAGMSEAMIAAWRAEVAGVWPAFADDEALAGHLTSSELLRVWLITGEELGALDLSRHAAPVSREAALVTWWRDLAKHAGYVRMTAVSEFSSKVAAALAARLGPHADLAFYPAFR
ncbi:MULTISPECIES: phosphotransferase [unclassified Amycolatopsis]|uniref:phosphotransferase n=1 Tax=unclassified Amycolatopsis TaxID=2618356 RepID=UPI002E12C109|nr:MULTISPECIES: phosphotransferase [unclassified Amycolatopsis]WSJ77954.1 phosphotransferase [Amycolatopsis sp. NBC_01307]WSK78473.1 phosphotransferase [Amycolatopsis sp. NBC_01286]